MKPHDLRHGTVLERRAMLGHVPIDTTQTSAQIKPAQLKRAVEFDEGKTLDILSR